jgi:hypothetical protein
MRVDRRDLGMLVAVALLGVGIGWFFTGPHQLVLINWDNGAYVSQESRSHNLWHNPPWNAHTAINQFYVAGARVVGLFGGTVIDGFRLIDSLCVALSGMLIADCVRRLLGSRLLGGLFALAWMTAWVNVFLALTLEDNLLFLTAAAAIVRLCLLYADGLDVRRSAAVGALVGMAFLLSFQSVLYLLLPLYTLLVSYGRQRRWRELGVRLLALFGGLFAMLIGWALFVAATSHVITIGMMMRAIFSRPVPSSLPSNLGETLHMLGDVNGQLRRLGIAAGYQISHTAYDLPAWGIDWRIVGGLTLGLLLAGNVVLTVWAIRRRSLRLHLGAAFLLGFTVLTSIYKDVDYAYLKRFDFVPLLFVPLVAACLAETRLLERRGVRVGLSVLLGVLVLTQVSLGVRWQRKALAAYPHLEQPNALPHPERAWYGRDGKSWFGWFRDIRQTHPQACRYVFSLEDVIDGSWNFDITASLHSEVPAHLVIGDPGAVVRWRYPPHMLKLEDARPLASACAYVSDGARRLLAAPPPKHK